MELHKLNGEQKGLVVYFIDWAKKIIEDSDAGVGREPHGDEGVVYRVTSRSKEYFLKVKFDSVSTKERDKLNWLKNRVPVPEVLGFVTKDNSKALLLSGIKGRNLKSLCKEWFPEEVIDKLVEALKKFHNIDIQDWPYEKSSGDGVLVHGDACLPNFIFDRDSFSGFIDLGDAQIGEIEVDLSAAIWSLQYNLGSGYGSMLLQKYGYSKTDEATVEKLRLMYEDYQRAHGFFE